MNRLGDETSPYLLQHKDNPVHWWAWGPQALEAARSSGRPILLSVGYAACHWCHVMAHESFEDEATAEVMNALFVCIKVDREERPDIDAIYMGALHRLGEQGGWPLTMFLDSAARPFYGGTYYPKDGRYGRPSFTSVLRQVARIYAEQPETVAHNAEALTGMLREAALGTGSGGGATASLDLAALSSLVARMPRACDPVHGGLGGAPKFPQWSFLALLWRGGTRFGHDSCRDATLLALERMCQGGIYDHLGGGLARYSVDERWLAPHFEKMLYDNAQFVELLTEAWRETHRPLFARRVDETVAWLLAEMTTAEGAFAASLDADSEGEEGKFYVWSAAEVAEVLGAVDPGRTAISSRTASPSPLRGGVRGGGNRDDVDSLETDYELFARVYDVTERGNWEGHTILNRLRSGDRSGLAPSDAHAASGPDEPMEARLAAMRERLLARRAARVRPGLDDKVLVDWNGLMIAALARAATVFDRPEWVSAAARAFAFICDRMTDGAPSEARLMHAWRSGRASARGLASDYANMIWAAIRLHEATGDGAYLAQARLWVAALDRHHWSEAGGYAASANDATDVLVRLRSASDDAAPNANAVMLANLGALAILTQDARYLERAGELRGAYAADLAAQPIGHCGLIAAAVDVEAPLHVAIQAGSSDTSGAEARGALVAALHGLALPGAIETISMATASADAGLAVAGKPAAAIVCAGPACSAPITEPAGLGALLRRVRVVAAGPRVSAGGA